MVFNKLWFSPTGESNESNIIVGRFSWIKWIWFPIWLGRTESLQWCAITRTEDVTETHWLLTSFSRMVEKSMGFLMTLRYPGTDLRLTGVRKGQASWWRSSSANRILNERKKISQKNIQLKDKRSNALTPYVIDRKWVMNTWYLVKLRPGLFAHLVFILKRISLILINDTSCDKSVFDISLHTNE